MVVIGGNLGYLRQGYLVLSPPHEDPHDVV